MAEKLATIGGFCVMILLAAGIGFYFSLESVLKISQYNTYIVMKCNYQDGKITDIPYRSAVIDALAFEKNESMPYGDVRITYPYSPYVYVNNATLFDFLSGWQTSLTKACYVNIGANVTRKPAIQERIPSSTVSIVIISMITCLLSLCGSSLGILMILKAKLISK